MAYSPTPDNQNRLSTSYSDRSSMSMQGHHTSEEDVVHQQFSPSTPEPHQPLLGGSPRSPYPLSRRHANPTNPVNYFVSSPLNPRSIGTGTASSSRPRVYDTTGGSTGLLNMANSDNSSLLPPKGRRFSQGSFRSYSETSLMSHSEDSKYPQAGGVPRPLSGLVAYAYDPLTDHNIPDAEDEIPLKSRGCNWRGLVNVGSLFLVVLGVVTLFTFYPIFHFFMSEQIQTLITGNVRVNSSGQTPDL
jgi:hypothetical protein